MLRAVGQMFSASIGPRAFGGMVEKAFPEFLESLHRKTSATQTSTAASMEMPRQDFAAVLAGERRATIGFLYRLPQAMRSAIAEDLAGPGYALVELPEATKTSDDLHALATAQRESGEAIAHGLDAMADGHLTRAEGVRVEAECDEAIAALLTIRERARLAQREGVIGLQAVRGMK